MSDNTTENTQLTFPPENDCSYAPFDKNEDCPVILPVETAPGLSEDFIHEAHSQQLNSGAFQKYLLVFFESFLDFAEYIGALITDLFKKIFFIVAPLVILPFSAFSKSFKKSKEEIKKLKAQPSTFRSDIKRIAFELEAVKKASKKFKHHSFEIYIKAIFKYFIISFSRHRHFWKSVFNALFPAAACLIVVAAMLVHNQSVYALQVFYNGQSIGYVETEDDFKKAKSLTSELLFEDSEDFFSAATFKTAIVRPNELSNPSVISETMLSLSDEKYIMACGVYVDSEFLCAVNNESDAKAVFDSILAPYEKRAKSGTTVGFVEEIQYIQGLYKEDSNLIWDSGKLRNEAADKVRVKVMKTKQRKEKIPYETVKKNSSYLSKGTKKTSQKGVNGEYLVTELLTYIDGKLSYTSTVSKVQTKAPQKEIILIGTNQGYSYGWNSGGNYYSSSFRWPTRGANAISSYYGYRSASISGWSFHGGIDIITGYGNSTGVPVVASASGTVISVTRSYSGYGHMVLIDHGGGIKTRYAHMQPGSISVYTGQKVYQGQQIGRIGSTGNSTGPHLHFEVIVNGVRKNPLNYIKR